MSEKKVAIMTWFHWNNYGTALQVTALYYILSSYGYKVDVVHYIPSGRRVVTSLRSEVISVIRRIYKRTILVFSKNNKYCVDVLRDEKYSNFLQKNLSFTRDCITPDDFKLLNQQYNAFICGSDQIWAPSIFDPRYFLDFVEDNSKKIAYAPSIGLSHIENEYVRKCMGNLISSISYLSIREKQGASLINSLCSKTAKVVLDPTLLLDYDQWRDIIIPCENADDYILCYFLGNNSNTWKHVEKVATELNIPLKILPIFEKDKKSESAIHGAGPSEFFNLLSNALFICTDSYHGTIFSILCEKPFYVFERFSNKDKHSQNSRVYSLLDSISLCDRLIKYNEPLRKVYTFEFDYSEAKKKLEIMREESLCFLEGAMNRG